MITVWGEGRGFRVVWMLEEMGLPYRLRPVDLLAGAENDPEFMQVNPAGFIPALVDGEVCMVESIAIIEYLAARYGPTPLVPEAGDAAFHACLQFLHLGEAGLAAAMFFYVNARRLPTEAERTNPTARHTLYQFQSRLGLVARRLEQAPYMAGEAFTAADISVTYALNLGQMGGGLTYEPPVKDYLARTRGRAAYARALETCTDTRAFYASAGDGA